MSLHGCLAGAELHRDLFVDRARGNECHDLALARRQRFVPPSQLDQLRPVISYRTVAINRLLNGVEKLLVTKGFREKVHRPRLQGLHRHGDITMSGDEHDLDRWIRRGKLALKVEAAQSRESHVEDEAARCVGALGSQEFLGRPERLRSEAYRTEKPRKGFTHRRVIVDDEDHRVIAAHGL